MKFDGLAVLKVVAFVLLFITVTAALIVANFLVYSGQNAYSALSERLHPSFYYHTVAILLLSSLFYTPFSYGISRYFIENTRREARFREIFYMFSKPMLFFKAVLLRLLVWVTRGMYQLLTLLCGVIAQATIYLIMLIGQGRNVLTMSLGQILRELEYAMDDRRFVYFSVFLWVVILIVFVLLFVRFMFCKYALLRYPELGAFESMKIGLFAMRGHLLNVLWHYLTYIAYYILLFGSLGLFAALLRPYRGENFSAQAIRRIEQARGAYFLQKSRKKA